MSTEFSWTIAGFIVTSLGLIVSLVLGSVALITSSKRNKEITHSLGRLDQHDQEITQDLKEITQSLERLDQRDQEITQDLQEIAQSLGRLDQHDQEITQSLERLDQQITQNFERLDQRDQEITQDLQEVAQSLQEITQSLGRLDRHDQEITQSLERLNQRDEETALRLQDLRQSTSILLRMAETTRLLASLKDEEWDPYLEQIQSEALNSGYLHPGMEKLAQSGEKLLEDSDLIRKMQRLYEASPPSRANVIIRQLGANYLFDKATEKGVTLDIMIAVVHSYFQEVFQKKQFA